MVNTTVVKQRLNQELSLNLFAEINISAYFYI